MKNILCLAIILLMDACDTDEICICKHGSNVIDGWDNTDEIEIPDGNKDDNASLSIEMIEWTDTINRIIIL